MVVRLGTHHKDGARYFRLVPLVVLEQQQVTTFPKLAEKWFAVDFGGVSASAIRPQGERTRVILS